MANHSLFNLQSIESDLESAITSSYSKEIKTGGDFNVFSDLHFINTNDILKISLSTF